DVEGETFNVVDDELPTSSELLAAYRGRVRGLVCLPVPYAAPYWAFASLELAARILAWFAQAIQPATGPRGVERQSFLALESTRTAVLRPRVPMREGVEVFRGQYDREPAQTN